MCVEGTAAAAELGGRAGLGRGGHPCMEGKTKAPRPPTDDPLPLQVRTNAPDRVSVDAATGVVHPRCTVAVRVFWSGGGDDAGATVALAPTSECLEKHLLDERAKMPTRIPYVFTCCRDMPGRFMLAYYLRMKVRREYVTVTADGFR